MNTNRTRTRLGSLGSTKKARCLVWLCNQQEGGREREGEKRERHAHTHSKSRRVASVLQTKRKIKRKDRLALAIWAIWAKTKPKPKQTQDSRQQHSPTHEKTNKQKRIYKGPVLEMLPGLPGCGKYRGGRGGSSQLNCHSHSRVAQGYHAANSR